ncbi:MAG TPA: insulinase family protein [Saprospiraceae bacterium]|nr:insulinase family protein [Saprospiraceae bacterium]
MNNFKIAIIGSLLSSFIFVQCNKNTKMMTDDSTMTTEQAVLDNWRSQAPSPGKAREIEIGDYQHFTLDNGLTCIVVENHKLPRVSYQLSLRNNQIMEGDMVGLVDFAGQMLARGTTTKSKADIDNAVDFIGANFNTSGYGMYGSTLKKHQAELLSIMTDVLYNPSFPNEEFDKIRTQTLSGLEAAKADPNSMIANVDAVLNYGRNHPYGEVQTVEAVNKIDLNACKAYYETFFKPGNAYLIIVGDISLEEAKSVANSNFGSWKNSAIPRVEYNLPEFPKSTQVSIANKEGAVQSVINVTYPIDMKPGSPDEIKATVMNNILGGGIFSGRLMQNLREDKAYTYGARSSLSSDRLVGNFKAYASVRNEVTDSSVYQFLYEMNRIVNEPVSQADLDLAKTSLAGSFARSLESPQTIARFALNTFRYGLPKDYYNTYLQRLDSVNISDISAMAKKYIRPDAANIVVVGNKDNISDNLLQFDSDGKIDYYDAFGREIKLDIPIPEGLTATKVIGDYINAIGGKEALMKVKTMETTAMMSMMGQEVTISSKYKDGDKYAMSMSMMGNVMQSQIVNGDKAMVSAMGQNQVISDQAQLKKMQSEAELFSVLHYDTDGTKLDLKGIETEGSNNYYKVLVTTPDGVEKTQFFDVKSKLLKKEMASETGPQGEMTITTEVPSYIEVNGIKVPAEVTIIGAAPMPLKMKITEVKINEPISDSDFSVE